MMSGEMYESYSVDQYDYLATFLPGYLARHLSDEHKHYMEHIHEFLLENRLFESACNYIDRTRRSYNISKVLLFISDLTFNNRVTYAYLTHANLAGTTVPGRGTAYVQEISVSTVKKCISFLSDHELICSFSQGLGYGKFYALSIRNVLSVASGSLLAIPRMSQKARLNYDYCQELYNLDCLKSLDNYIRIFNKKEFNDIGVVKKYLEDCYVSNSSNIPDLSA